MCKILNAREVGKTSTANRVYVGRPSKWGNPFALGRDGSRSEVISKYRCWVVTQADLMNALIELRGKDLICWCAAGLSRGSTARFVKQLGRKLTLASHV
jgi:Domain of unknown function (DUF4326)